MARNERAGAAASHTPGSTGVPTDAAQVVSLDHRRDMRDLLVLLAVAHRNLDVRGVPRTRTTTP